MDTAPLRLSTVVRFYLPMAVTWLLMCTEGVVTTAAIARMADSKLQLAAFGVALSLLAATVSPVSPMLTVGNALARDRVSLRLSRRFLLVQCVFVSVGMLALSLTSAFNLVVVRLIGVPADVAVSVRPCLWALIPWPAVMAVRRFWQGIMIRHGHTRQMSYGTMVRMSAMLLVLVAGLLWRRLDGAVLAGLALTCGGVVEAFYVYRRSRSAVRAVLGADIPSGEPLTMRALLRFYGPLSLTSVVVLSTTPILNYGLARSPSPIGSLAAWPVANGQIGVVRSFGLSLYEAIVALLDGPATRRILGRFVIGVGAVSLFLLVGLAFTPVGPWWQQRIAGLDAELTSFAVPALRWGMLVPLLEVIRGWLRGNLVVARSNGAIIWATVCNLIVLLVVLLIGAHLAALPGASLAAIATTVSQLVEGALLLRSVRIARRRHDRGLLHSSLPTAAVNPRG